MMKPSLLSSLPICVCGFLTQAVTAATVQYSGSVFFNFGTPIVGGYVVAGTFAPGFDPYNGGQHSGTNYNCVYGDDVCNLNPGAYDAAVSDGNFIPIGTGTVTDQNGRFSTSGSTSTPAGTPIWLFAFEDNSRDSGYQVLASSSNPAWQTPSQPTGVTTLTASDANLFVLGTSHPRGVALRGIPIPEPSSMALSVLGCLAVLVAAVQRTKGYHPLDHVPDRCQNSGTCR